MKANRVNIQRDIEDEIEQLNYTTSNDRHLVNVLTAIADLLKELQAAQAQPAQDRAGKE